MTTPKEIKNLKEGQVFVFGSNLNGNHIGGAAKQALDNFGAIEGQGEGLQGQSYALPTLDKNMSQFTDHDLRGYVLNLYKCAKENPEKQFLVTKVGCGIAGYSEETMKQVFKDCENEKPKNIILPPGWAKIYGYKAFNKGLICRDFQYELGKDFYHKEELSICASGFHFCKSLGDVYNFYNFCEDTVVAEVESEGEVIDEEEKSVTDHLRITRILNAEQAANNNGLDNLGHSNTGHSNTGDSNTGHSNTGHRNTGDRNTGDRNTGHRNTGHRNTGDSNTGDSNTGDSNTGDSNTGHSNTGHRNTGHRNTGDRNTGHSNTGHSNTGDWNTGDWNTGNFNTITPDEVLVFNKKCKKENWDNASKPSCLYFNVNIWVNWEDMTEEERQSIGTAKHTGGYMKKLDYKEAFTESLKKASKKDLELIKKLPNFDSKIFEDISGFKI